MSARTRSRAVILPLACCLAIAFSEPAFSVACGGG